MLFSVKLLILLLLCSSVSYANSNNVNDNLLTKEIQKFIKGIPKSENWQIWIKENTPTYGNYCGPGYGDPTFEAPCLSKIDCLCKEHDFGYSLKKYAEADAKMVQQLIHGLPSDIFKNPKEELFIENASLIMLAGKLQGIDLQNKVSKAIKSPNKSQKSLQEIIDANKVFKNKIAEIRKERKKFELKSSTTPMRNISTLFQGNAVYFNLLGLASGTFLVAYERKVSRTISFQIPISFVTSPLKNPTVLTYLNQGDIGIGLGLLAKYYVSGNTFNKGVFFGPKIMLRYESLPKTKDISHRSDQYATLLSGSIVAGFSKFLPFGLTVEPQFGIGYVGSVHISGAKVDSNIRTDGVLFETKLMLGYGW